jgi:hypothetical protein
MSYDSSRNRLVVAGGSPGGGVRYSDAWELLADLTITGQPQPVSMLAGGTASISVQTHGPATGFHWRKAGVPLSDGGRISGATTPTLTVSSIQTSDQAAYDCVITNSCGSVPSNAAEISCKAIINQQPTGGNLVGGESLVLTAGVTTGGTTTYRWKKDGVNLFNSANYAGVSTRSLTIFANDPTESGAYTLTITNTCGGITTVPVQVTITCSADFNNDGGIDFFDYLDFVDAFTTNAANADFNHDDSVDFFDYLDFVDRFTIGC